MNKILELFVKEPEREFHVREVARLVEKSPTTASFYLEKFEEEGILKSERKLNHLVYKANAENKAFKQLKLNYNLEILNKSGLIEFLENEFNHPEAIGLFGSFAKAENIPISDIDLFVISSSDKQPVLKKYEKNLGHKIQLFVFSRNDIEKMKQKNKELLNNILNGIILYGYLEVLK